MKSGGDRETERQRKKENINKLLLCIRDASVQGNVVPKRETDRESERERQTETQRRKEIESLKERQRQKEREY